MGTYLSSLKTWEHTKAFELVPGCLIPHRGHPCLGLAAIFAGMLYNVQIIQNPEHHAR